MEAVIDPGLDALLSKWDTDGPGLVAAVLRHGEVVHCRGYGMASLEHDIRIGPGTAFRVASITKHFLCALALMLEEEGVLSLDATAADLFPALARHPHPPTLRHMLTNTAGITDFFDVLELSGAGAERPVSRAEMDDMLQRQETLNFSPGDSFSYSNYGFRIVSAVIEQKTGRDLGDLLHERIFAPLGMWHSRLAREDRILVDRLATGHITLEGHHWRSSHGLSMDGEAAIVSTVEDLIAWERNLLAPKVGSKELFARQSAPLRYNDGTTGIYGLGLIAHDWRGSRLSGHGGLLPGFVSQIVRLPEHAVSVIVMANSSAIESAAIAFRLAQHVLGDKAALQGTTAALRDRLGLYLDPARDELLELALDGDQVVCTAQGIRNAVEPLGGDRWRLMTVVFDRVLSLEGNALTLIECGKPHALQKLAPAADSGRVLGTYYSAELRAHHTVAAENGGLRLHVQGELGRNTFNLEPLAPDLYRVRRLAAHWLPFEPVVRVVGDGTGPAQALRFTTSRIKGLLARRVA